MERAARSGGAGARGRAVVRARGLRRAGGFTLLEVLVVVAVIALLLGVLAPSLAGAREAARSTACAAKLRQVAALMALYEHGNGGVLPRVRSAAYGQLTPSWDPLRRMDRTWVDHFAALGYLPGAQPDAPVPAELLCPTARGYENDPSWAGYMPHYGYNVYINPPESLEATFGERSFRGRPAVTAVSASATILLADSRHVDVQRGWHAMGNQHWVDVRHAGAANVAYVDGSQRAQRPPYRAPESAADRAHPFSQVFFVRRPSEGGGSW